MTIAACLIVKNESQVIYRCLNSLKSLVDKIVIVDTGSTDNTVQLIKDYPIFVRLYERPWVHFAHNRTELIKLTSPEADYLLLLDADQTIEGHLPPLTADVYSLRIRMPSGMEFFNTLLIRSALPWHYEGVVHEYLTCTEAKPAETISTFTIIEHSDGGLRPPGSQPRWEWDSMILEQELAKEPNNPRYVFYLARTYEDLSHTKPHDPNVVKWKKNALVRYKQRTEMTNGYSDEIFYSFLRMGTMLLSEDTGLMPLLRAWQHCPHRWEPIYEACRWLNQQSLHQASYSLSKTALAKPPTPFGLFIQPEIYEYFLLFEHSISAYWVGCYQESWDACQTLLSKKLPNYLRDTVLRNIKFSQQRLNEEANYQVALNKTPTINIVVISPSGHNHSMAFNEVAHLLLYSLQSAGIETTLQINKFESCLNIVLGYNLLTDTHLIENHKCIIYQLEQISSKGNNWWNETAFQILKKAYQVWDFNKENISFLTTQGIQNVIHLPIGFHEKLQTIKPVTPDIDVLFYGALNLRRQRVVEELQRHCKVLTLFGVYGNERDQHIARSKIILNVHYYETPFIEQVRISYLLNNHCFVLSEDAPINPYGEYLVTASYADLVYHCLYYIENEKERTILADKGYHHLSQQPMVNSLKKILKIN